MWPVTPTMRQPLASERVRGRDARVETDRVQRHRPPSSARRAQRSRPAAASSKRCRDHRCAGRLRGRWDSVAERHGVDERALLGRRTPRPAAALPDAPCPQGSCRAHDAGRVLFARCSCASASIAFGGLSPIQATWRTGWCRAREPRVHRAPRSSSRASHRSIARRCIPRAFSKEPTTVGRSRMPRIRARCRSRRCALTHARLLRRGWCGAARSACFGTRGRWRRRLFQAARRLRPRPLHVRPRCRGFGSGLRVPRAGRMSHHSAQDAPHGTRSMTVSCGSTTPLHLCRVMVRCTPVPVVRAALAACRCVRLRPRRASGAALHGRSDAVSRITPVPGPASGSGFLCAGTALSPARCRLGRGPHWRSSTGAVVSQHAPVRHGYRDQRITCPHDIERLCRHWSRARAERLALACAPVPCPGKANAAQHHMHRASPSRSTRRKTVPTRASSPRQRRHPARWSRDFPARSHSPELEWRGRILHPSTPPPACSPSSQHGPLTQYAPGGVVSCAATTQALVRGVSPQCILWSHLRAVTGAIPWRERDAIAPYADAVESLQWSPANCVNNFL